MKLTLKREKFTRGLLTASKLVKQRATLPVLSNIMLMTDKGRLKIAATDLESAVVTWVGAKIDEEGAVTVPAKTIVDYITNATDETVDLYSEGSDLNIKGARHHADIKGIAIEEFPIIPKISGGINLKVKSKELKSAIFTTAVAAAFDETRPVLAGILFRVNNEQLIVVATDSYRLAEYKIKAQSSLKKGEFIIPQRTAAEVARLLPADDSEVEITSGDNQVLFKFDDIEFSSRQIEGSFPDYEQIIPKEFVFQSEMDKNELLEAIKTANVFARESGSNVKMSMTEGGISISAIAAQVGKSETSVSATTSGKPLEVAFNAKFIMDALNAMEGERVKFNFSGPLNPGLILPFDSDNFKYVVMPLRNE